MPISVKQGSDYKLVYKVWQKVSGVWKEVPRIHYKIAGTWKIVHIGQTAFIFNQSISANTNGYVMRTAAIAAGWDTIQPLQATITINSGVVVGALNAENFAFSSGFSFSEGSSLRIINNGTIAGMGGKGADSASKAMGYTTVAVAGGDGGTALFINLNTTLVNNGAIYAGGGGGGQGQSYINLANPTIEFYRGGAGGGGRGAGTSLAGVSDTYEAGWDSQVWYILATGGTLTTSGTGSSNDGVGNEIGFFYSGLGGAGGLLASSGGRGLNCDINAADGTVPPDGGASGSGRYSTRGFGGAAGKAISGTSFITYQTTGTILGVIE